jgi:hypothetical protein
MISLELYAAIVRKENVPALSFAAILIAYVWEGGSGRNLERTA